MFGLLAVVSIAWYGRRRHPAFALAILFYVAGQLIESTSIPLELYFEHRNYLPALLMFWPLGLVLAERSTMPLVKGMLLVGLPISLATLTYLRAELWGDSSSQAMLWAKLNPDSPRAQASAAEVEMQRGQPQRAVERLQRLLKAQPNQAQLAFNLIDARCMSGGLRPDDWEETKVAMHGTPNTGPLFAQWFERVLPIALSGRCPGLELSQLQQLIDVGLRNPHLGETGPKQDLLYLQGRLALAQHRPGLAQNDFVEALDLQVHPGMALKAAATLGAAGYPAQGLSLLNHYERVNSREASPGLGMPMLHSWILKEQGYWPGEVRQLRQQLTLDAQERNTNTSGTIPPDTSR
jgi:protein O-mannosyl-transferase